MLGQKRSFQCSGCVLDIRLRCAVCVWSRSWQFLALQIPSSLQQHFPTFLCHSLLTGELSPLFPDAGSSWWGWAHRRCAAFPHGDSWLISASRRGSSCWCLVGSLITNRQTGHIDCGNLAQMQPPPSPSLFASVWMSFAIKAWFLCWQQEAVLLGGAVLSTAGSTPG